MNMVTRSVLGHLHMRKQNAQSTGLAFKKENERSTSGRGARASVPNKVPQDFGPVTALGPRFSIPVARQ